MRDSSEENMISTEVNSPADSLKRVSSPTKEKVYESEHEALRAISADVTDEIEPDAYYLSVSRRIRIFRYIVLLAVVCLSLVMLTVYSSVINLTGIKEFFFSFLDIDNEYRTNTVIYAGTDEYSEIAAYKSYIATLNNDAIVLYGTDGSTHLVEKINMKYPVMTSSSRYILVYDVDGREAVLLNSVDVIKVFDIGNDVYFADVADSGEVAVLTHAVSTPSVVIAYDDSFNECFRWTSADKYTSQIEILDGEDKIVIASFNSETGEMRTYLSVYDLKSGETVSSQIYESATVLDLVENKEGFVAVCTDKLLFFDKNGNEIADVSLNRYGVGIRHVSVSDSYVALNMLMSDYADGSKILVFNNVGELCFENSCKYSVTAFKCTDKTVYTVMHGELNTVDISSGKIETDKLDKEYTKISVFDNGGIILSSKYDTVIYR